MNIRKLIIEDVRCFAGGQDRPEFDIRPLTFLVGENSTGKSTALGCLQTLSAFIRTGSDGLNFNVEPYNMGAFTDIARISRPRKESFQLGVEFQLGGQKETLEYSLTLTEKDEGSEPAIKIQRILFSDGHEIIIKKSNQQVRSNEEIPLEYGVQIEDIQKRSDGKETFIIAAGPPFLEISSFSWLLGLPLYIEEDKENSSSVDKLLSFIEERKKTFFKRCLFTKGLDIPETYSFGPVRSQPRRTYDPVREDISPEGSEMPMVLMNISRTSKEPWDQLKGRLIEFGESSGLFTDINVRKFGKKYTTSDPFRLQIKVRGPKVSLRDVGYGVSQILPILVRIFTTHLETTFLMQQPEVHLHPRAQAELLSLLIANQRHNYVIETHSDYMIDRARIEIMEGNIAPEDVSLIYLEPVGNSVKVHNIEFDEQANMLNVPASYRQFFLKESDRLLGLD